MLYQLQLSRLPYPRRHSTRTLEMIENRNSIGRVEKVNFDFFSF